jgi:hypothetical protein
MPAIDHEISLRSVAAEKDKDDRGLLKRIFGGKDDKDKDKKKN